MTNTKLAILGIDVGTTAVKIVLVSQDGAILAEAEVEQPLSIPRPGWTEQDPRMWWSSTVSGILEVMGKARQLSKPVEVLGIGLSGQMHSSVFLDESGEVIRPALLWNDVRTTIQCQQITDKMGTSGLNRTVGNPALEGFTAPKVLWLRDNEPENYSRLRTLLLAKDYVRYRLTGEFATDPSDASGTILYDVRKRNWSREILDKLDISAEILPRVVESTEVSGTVTYAVAGELGLPSGIPVMGGGADNAAGAVGSGVVSQGRIQSSIGTSGALVQPIATAHVDEDMRLHTFCHSAPDMWYLMGVVLSAGSSLRWLRDILSTEQLELDYRQLTSEAEQVPVGSDGLVFLPYLTGERTPHNDSNARGVFFGLHFGHTRGHMVRAVMEGVAFALRDSLEIMKAQGTSIGRVHAIGGGARSELWRKIQANVFNAPVVTVEPAGGPSYGAAILGAVGTGIFSSIAEGIDSWVSVRETTEPDGSVSSVYDQQYELYRSLYPALRKRFAEASFVAESLRQP